MSELIDNRAQRVRTLKGIIKRLHAGDAPDDVRNSLKELVCQTDYSEVMAMEQELIADGMPVEEIQGMCDLHSQVTREVLVQLAPAPVPPGHPVDTFRRENEALRESVARLQKAMNGVLETADDGDASARLLEWRQALNELQDVDKHYQRKEHLLFTCLERHGITGPSKVMWGKDDQIRELLKDTSVALRESDTSVAEWKLLAATTGAAAAGAVHEMIYKEEQILLPICLQRFTADEWAEIWASSPRYGWCLVEPRQGYKPVTSEAADRASADGGVSLPTGTLALEQLIAIFSTLPVDLTFVDANDRVAFFSEGPSRVFARSRAIVGRMVQNCHPPRSVDVVERILSDFREGRQNVAEFWIQFVGRFVHIRYFAVRSEDGRYLGTLEVTQDVGPIRALEGERRLFGVRRAIHSRCSMSLSIGPEITVGALLSTFPALEGVLIDMAPAFAKLRNPVVRRTVAKIATLEQVAAIGGVNLQAMILKLRAAAGVDGPDEPALAPAPNAGADASYLMAGLVVEEIDGDAMLERGVHPIGKIREAVGALKTGESVLLRSSFVPQPLIETLRRAGATVHSTMLAGKHLTWFGKVGK